MISNGHRIFLECGPGNTLSALARQQEGRAAVISCLPRAGERRSDSLSVLRALGKLWLKGVDVNWNAFYAHERRMRVPLPHYPFERQRYWIKPDGRAEHERKKRTIDDWFYVPGWQPSALVHPDGLKIDSPILVLEDGFGFSRRLAEGSSRRPEN